MLTPSSGVIRTPSSQAHTCHDCGRELVNMTRYPGPVQFRCVNRACTQSCLPVVAQAARNPASRY